MYQHVDVSKINSRTQRSIPCETYLVDSSGAICPTDEFTPSFKGAEKVGGGRIEHVLLTRKRCRHGDVVLVEHGPFSGLQENQVAGESRFVSRSSSHRILTFLF